MVFLPNRHRVFLAVICLLLLWKSMKSWKQKNITGKKRRSDVFHVGLKKTGILICLFFWWLHHVLHYISSQILHVVLSIFNILSAAVFPYLHDNHVTLTLSRDHIDFPSGVIAVGQQSGAVVLGFIPGQGLPCWSLHVLPVFVCIPSRYSDFLPPSKHMYLGLC